MATSTTAPNTRERFLRVMSRAPVDRGIFANRGGSLAEWRPAWQRQGMPADFDCDFFFDFCFGDTLEALEVNLLFQPPFEIEVLEDEARPKSCVISTGSSSGSSAAGPVRYSNSWSIRSPTGRAGKRSGRE